MKILNRYVLREHAGPLTFAAASLTSLLLLNYIAKQIGQLVGKGLSWTVIVEFIGLSVPFTVAMTLPMAVLVAVLYAFSRLAAENEITALKANGVSIGRVLIPVVMGGGVLTALMIAFNDQVLPRANHRLRTLQSDIARKKPTFALRPRVINEVSPGKLFLNAAHIDPATNRLREVVIYDLGDPTRSRTIYADSGLMALSPESGELELTLFDGSMSDVTKTTPSELQRLFYRVDLIRVKGVGDQLTRSTNDDFKSDREMTVCELQQTVAAGEESRAQAVAEVRQVMVDAAKAAATGVVPTRTVAPRGAAGRREWGLGRVYCDGLDAVAALVARHRGPPAGPGAVAGRAVAVLPPPYVPPSAGGAPAPSAGGVPVPSVGGRPATTPAATVARPGAPAVTRPGTPVVTHPGAPPAVTHPGAPVATHPGAPVVTHPGAPVATHPGAPPVVTHPGAPVVTHPGVPPAVTRPGTPAQAAPGHIAPPARTLAVKPAPHPLPGARPWRAPSEDDRPNWPPAPPARVAGHRSPVGRPTPVAPGVRPGPIVPGGSVPAVLQHGPPSPTEIAMQTLTPSVEAVRARVEQSDQTVDTYDNQIQKMFAIAFACVIFVFLGAPIALRFPRGGVGMVLGVSLGVFALYYIGLIAGEPLAQRGVVPPFLAMWTSNIVFAIVGLFLLSRMNRESSTSRDGEWSEFMDRTRRRLRGVLRRGERRTALRTEGA